ncbi:hypothetical protein V492_04580 [Pseudogymnoascus sp. VKM F-4246]|nr:hypothetical protein V492_04580 [Pseudogymnoascus sp. VKM F-4246]
MSPPPVTPSPHRFIIKNPSRPAPSQHAPQSSAPQFKATPRFSFAASQGVGTIGSQHAVSTPRFNTAASAEVSGIRGKEDEQDDHVARLNERRRAAYADMLSQTWEDDEATAFQSPALKRRRLSLEPILSSQPIDSQSHGDTNVDFEQEDEQHDQQKHDHEMDDDFEDLLSMEPPTLSSPPPPVHRPAPSAPRFVLSTPLKPTSSTPAPIDSTDTFLRPPRFKPPDEEREAAVEPLPEHFSPRRRGQKFLAGGLAAEVRGWLVERESQATRSARNPMREDGWKIKIAVDEVKGGHGAGMTLVRGRRVGSNGDEGADLYPIRMILGGEEGMAEGIKKGEPAAVGKVVGVKGPAWEVDVDGVRWGRTYVSKPSTFTRGNNQTASIKHIRQTLLMARVLVYSIALVAFLGATVLTLTSIFLPYWLTIDSPITPDDHLKITYGLHRACSSLTNSCRPFPSQTDCLSLSSDAPDFCTIWRSSAFLMSFTGILEIVTLITFGIILAGGLQKRAQGWKVLVGLMGVVVAGQVASTAMVAYLLDYDERFFPGWELGKSWVMGTVSWAVVLCTAGGVGVASYLLPPEGGYELIPSERANE